MSKLLKLSEIRRDGGTQIRVGMSQDTIDAYAEAYKEGVKLPPVIVFFDCADYWLADGFQRTLARQQAGFDSIDADIRNGTQRDAILYACGANAEHGTRRTNEDKRRAVETLLRDEEWSGWSVNAIAKQCKVSHDLVTRMQSEPHLSDRKDSPSLSPTEIARKGGYYGEDAAEAASKMGANPPRPRKVERNGTMYEQNTANIGRKRQARDALLSMPEPEYDEALDVDDEDIADEKAPRGTHVISNLTLDTETAAELWSSWAESPERWERGWQKANSAQRGQLLAALRLASKAANKFRSVLIEHGEK